MITALGVMIFITVIAIGLIDRRTNIWSPPTASASVRARDHGAPPGSPPAPPRRTNDL